MAVTFLVIDVWTCILNCYAQFTAHTCTCRMRECIHGHGQNMTESKLIIIASHNGKLIQKVKSQVKILYVLLRVCQKKMATNCFKLQHCTVSSLFRKAHSRPQQSIGAVLASVSAFPQGLGTGSVFHSFNIYLRVSTLSVDKHINTVHNGELALKAD